MKLLPKKNWVHWNQVNEESCQAWNGQLIIPEKEREWNLNYLIPTLFFPLYFELEAISVFKLCLFVSWAIVAFTSNCFLFSCLSAMTGNCHPHPCAISGWEQWGTGSWCWRFSSRISQTLSMHWLWHLFSLGALCNVSLSTL